jgi:hypothetical protein
MHDEPVLPIASIRSSCGSQAPLAMPVRSEITAEEPGDQKCFLKVTGNGQRQKAWNWNLSISVR